MKEKAREHDSRAFCLKSFAVRLLCLQKGRRVKGRDEAGLSCLIQE